MFLVIDKLSQEPIYLQIRAQIVAAIAHGDLVPGEVLPSVRSLARDLGVNLHTINKAYAVLQDEGYVTINGRKGTLVTEPSRAQGADRLNDVERRLGAAFQQLALEYIACGGTREGLMNLMANVAESVCDGEER